MTYLVIRLRFLRRRSDPCRPKHCDVKTLTCTPKVVRGPYTSLSSITQGPVLHQNTTDPRVLPRYDVFEPRIPNTLWILLKKEFLLLQCTRGPQRDIIRVPDTPDTGTDVRRYHPYTRDPRKQMEKGRDVSKRIGVQLGSVRTTKRKRGMESPREVKGRL